MRGGLIPTLADAFNTVLDARLDSTARTPLVVAFSGGGDSLALLRLTLPWAKAKGRSVLALTVDHRLHPESDRWTIEAGAKARALGADWGALVWEGEKPQTGVPAAARQARHILLAGAARDAGARVILMGHTANDIAEGEVMRAADAPGIGRLRDWSPSPVWPEGRGIFLLRPLLDVQRSALRAFLCGLGETWFDDPANEDMRHPRIRARRALLGLPPEPPPRSVSETRPGADLARRLIVQANGTVTAPRAAFATSAPGEAASVLAAAVLCVSGRSRPPRSPQLHRLLSRICEAHVDAVTLGGCRIEMSQDRIVIARAPPRRGETPAPLEPAAWIAARFAAACGLVANEADAGAPSPATR